MPDHPVDLYDNAYTHFANTAEAAVRRQTYGEDIGQSSWMTAQEWLSFADLLEVTDRSHVLEVGSGSGGPATYLALKRGCRVTGVDINDHGVRNGAALAAARGVADRADFRAVDAGMPLPFGPASFDAVVSNDAMCHIGQRLAVLREWYRVLRPGKRALFTDAMVITGVISHEELATRSSIGFYIFVPPGENERLLREAGFEVLGVDNLTTSTANVSRRWHDARAQYRETLVSTEGQENFDGLQRFLACVRILSEERRLSRFCYLAKKN
ncbi:MAG: class I SAM-dependent methyltransferase [Acidobacteria bacterium]|nr:MAG: class I SAM-dependent methyltransferase [Acidobacteriota bacterium]